MAGHIGLGEGEDAAAVAYSRCHACLAAWCVTAWLAARDDSSNPGSSASSARCLWRESANSRISRALEFVIHSFRLAAGVISRARRRRECRHSRTRAGIEHPHSAAEYREKWHHRAFRIAREQRAVMKNNYLPARHHHRPLSSDMPWRNTPGDNCRAWRRQRRPEIAHIVMNGVSRPYARIDDRSSTVMPS